MPILTRIAPTRDDLITQNVQAVESMYGADLRTRAEDVKLAAIEIDTGLNIAWESRRMIAIIPSETNLPMANSGPRIEKSRPWWLPSFTVGSPSYAPAIA
jgi:hypothetical protein